MHVAVPVNRSRKAHSLPLRASAPLLRSCRSYGGPGPPPPLRAGAGGHKGRPYVAGANSARAELQELRAPQVMAALAAFGAPMAEISEADFSRPGAVYQIGVAPGRIDLLTELTGLTFEEAWVGRVRHPFADLDTDFIGLEAFIKNKRATGRTKDLADIEGLE